MLLTRWIISSLKEKTAILPLKPLVKTRQVGNKVLPDAYNVLYCTAAVAFILRQVNKCVHMTVHRHGSLNGIWTLLAFLYPLMIQL